MKVVSVLYDGRIKAYDVLFDFKIADYLNAVRGAMAKNQYQRKRVSSSKTIYSLLRQDIIQGCVIPPVVLALAASTCRAMLWAIMRSFSSWFKAM